MVLDFGCVVGVFKRQMKTIKLFDTVGSNDHSWLGQYFIIVILDLHWYCNHLIVMMFMFGCGTTKDLRKQPL